MANGEKRKFLFVSHSALIGDLAWQIRKEGHEVRYYIQDKLEKDVCDGFVDKIDDWESNIDWADIIIFDDIGFGQIADKLRKEGKLVVGGNEYTDNLENDREFGQQEMRMIGISTLPHYDFTNFEDATKFVKENPGRYVLKPSGKAQYEKDLLFIGEEEDGKDVLSVLEHYQKTWSKLIKTFQLQKHVSGVEIAVGAFFNGKQFITPINVNFEHKRMFPGEIGPPTGEMGTSMFWGPYNKIFEATLGKMSDAFRQVGYVGYIDVNCIVNSRGIYPLEFTCRFGYPTVSIQMEGITSPWSEFLYALAKGENYDLKTKKGFQIGVVIAVPPFPFNDAAAFKRYSEGKPVLFKRPESDGVHIGDIKLIDGHWVLAGRSGYTLIVTGSGMTMDDARKQAYRRVKNIMIPNMFYRTDIGNRWYSDSDKLWAWGYLY